jgi:hypothetical protein
MILKYIEKGNSTSKKDLAFLYLLFVSEKCLPLQKSSIINEKD